MSNPILDWCASRVGRCHVVSGNRRPDGRSSVSRLQFPKGYCYLKVHEHRDAWEREVHGYEQWAAAFQGCAPPLLAVREDEPLALIVGELPGTVLERVQLPVAEERAAWRTAGRMLAGLHGYAPGEFFGPCRRNGAAVGTITDAVEYVSNDLEREIDKAVRAGQLSDEELAVMRAALALTPAFAGERPIPCHRDYCPANWLVSDAGVWCGVIDFEFACWDVRVADFARYPGWEWINRPDLLEALFDGYGRPLMPQEEQQRLVANSQYALSAITWGNEVSYLGFVAEGRQALEHLSKRL
jgi:Ser/Thr protein kinase RdoA (MazF antagonist)